jgi:hypothetical protein
MLSASTVAAAGMICAALCAQSAFGAIDLGAGSDQPAAVYDHSSGYTYVVWRAPSNEAIDVCAIAGGGSSCNGGGGPYQLADQQAKAGGSRPLFLGAQVLVMPGGAVVVLGNVDGVSNAVVPSGYANAGVVAWSSPAGGRAFGESGQGIADSGKLLADQQGEMPDEGAAALSATQILAYGNEYPFKSGATDFTLTSPAPAATPLVDYTEAFGNQEAVDSGQLATEEYPVKSGKDLVVTAGTDLNQPTGCPAGSEMGTGYGVADGTPAELQKKAAWSESYFKPIACVAKEAVLTGGSSGQAPIGVVEAEGAGLNGSGEDGVYWRAFSPTAGAFGAPVLISNETSLTLLGADDLSASEDPVGDLYAMWLDDRGFELSYSTNQGASWAAPVVAASEVGDPVVIGIDEGSFQIAFTAKEQEYLEPLDYKQLYEAQNKPAEKPSASSTPPPAATTISTVQFGGGITGGSMTVPQGTAVGDQAHIAGTNAKTAGGTVTYTLYKDSKCTLVATAGSVASVVNGVAGASALVIPGPGTYYWQVSYSGDGANAASTSTCGSEVLVVALQANTLGLPSSKQCLSKRAFLVHPRAPRGVKLVSIEVQINGRFVKRGKLSHHATTVSLVGLPKGTFTVSLISRSSRGKLYEELRTYHTCVPKPKHKHHKRH